jgi:hypothetical protein
MTTGVNGVRIALANLRHHATPDEAMQLAEEAIAGSARRGADAACFPGCGVIHRVAHRHLER